MGQERINRVAEEIKKEVGRIIHDELKDPRIGFVTLTEVKLSRDLHLARVYFSLLGTEKQLRDTQIALARSAGFIRKLLAKRMNLRYTPEVVFKLDKGIEYSIHISEVIDQLKKAGQADGRP